MSANSRRTLLSAFRQSARRRRSDSGRFVCPGILRSVQTGAGPSRRCLLQPGPIRHRCCKLQGQCRGSDDRSASGWVSVSFGPWVFPSVRSIHVERIRLLRLHANPCQKSILFWQILNGTPGADGGRGAKKNWWIQDAPPSPPPLRIGSGPAHSVSGGKASISRRQSGKTHGGRAGRPGHRPPRRAGRRPGDAPARYLASSPTARHTERLKKV